MADVQPRHTKDEAARLGDAVYDRDIEPLLKPGDRGKYVAIDIETGAYEVDGDLMAACRRLRSRIPEAQVWMKRVGYDYVHRIGPRPRVRGA